MGVTSLFLVGSGGEIESELFYKEDTLNKTVTGPLLAIFFKGHSVCVSSAFQAVATSD